MHAAPRGQGSEPLLQCVLKAKRKCAAADEHHTCEKPLLQVGRGATDAMEDSMIKPHQGCLTQRRDLRRTSRRRLLCATTVATC